VPPRGPLPPAPAEALMRRALAFAAGLLLHLIYGLTLGLLAIAVVAAGNVLAARILGR
jgi:hypothetical protein